MVGVSKHLQNLKIIYLYIYTIWLFNSSPWKITMLLRTGNHLFLWAIYTMAMLVITRGSTRFLVETTCWRLLRQSPGRTRRTSPAATAMRPGMWPWWQLRRGLDLRGRGQELNGFPGNSLVIWGWSETTMKIWSPMTDPWCWYIC